jgi:hypothetical protein
MKVFKYIDYYIKKKMNTKHVINNFIDFYKKIKKIIFLLKLINFGIKLFDEDFDFLNNLRDNNNNRYIPPHFQ